jgi:protein TonB
MSTTPAPRLTLRAFESTRRLSWSALRHQVVGVSAELLVLGAFAALGWLEQRRAADDANRADEAVRFFAPSRQSAPPPAEERLSFVGLGGADIAVEGEAVVPTDDGRRVAAVTERGARLVTEEAAALRAESESPRAMTEIEVDSTAALDPTAEGPEYPPELMEAGVQGVVYAQFVVDSTGHADTLTMRVLDKVEPQFVQAVRRALPRMKYKPAVFAGRRVSQLVQQAFVFQIKPAGPPA